MKSIKFTVEVNTTYQYEVEDYDRVVLLIRKIDGKFADWDLYRKSFYNRMVKKNGQDWVTQCLEIPRTENLTVVTRGYLNWYLKGMRFNYDRDENIKSLRGVRNVLKAKEWDRVVVDFSWYNALIYDLDGKPIVRPIYVDYINNRLQEEEGYLIKRLVNHLKKNKKVSHLEVVEVPYYNGGGRAVEFFYLPTKEEFKKLVMMSFRNIKRAPDEPPGGIGLAAYIEIVRSLKLDKFKDANMIFGDEHDD